MRKQTFNHYNIHSRISINEVPSFQWSPLNWKSDMVQRYPGKDSRTLLRERIRVEKNSCLFSQLSVAVSCFNRQEICGVQGWRSGLSTRLPPMWPEFGSQIRRHMWVEFVCFLLCTERFSQGTPVSPLLQNQHLT